MSVFVKNENNKIFDYYSYLPRELQMMVINEMQLDYRCRFMRCSKLCGKQVESSKEFIYGIGINGENEREIDVFVEFSDPNKNQQNLFGFRLRFEEEEDNKRKFMKYLDQNNEKELWRMELKQSVNLPQLAMKIFKFLMNAHQNTVRSVSIVGEILCQNWNSFDLEIKRLKNLESLEVYDYIDIQQFISNLRHPLKDFMVYGNPTQVFWLYADQIYQVQDKLIMHNLELDKQQFLRLSAPHVEINIGEMTENDVFEIIKSWQNGTIGKEVKCYQWNAEFSDFDVEEFINLFGAEYEESFDINSTLEIKHNKDDMKSAIIEYNNIGIRFCVNN